jgi:hypothetical protein
MGCQLAGKNARPGIFHFWCDQSGEAEPDHFPFPCMYRMKQNSVQRANYPVVKINFLRNQLKFRMENTGVKGWRL